jgi:predicted nucleic acid-binding protein
LILYLDTSALVKLYVDEADSDLVRSAVGRASVTASHVIAYAEARTAFARKAQDPTLAARISQWRSDLNRDWETLHLVEVSETLVRRAGDLAEEYRLRGYDAVHLAAAEAVSRIVGVATPFRIAAFDTRFSDAARAHGLSLLRRE